MNSYRIAEEFNNFFIGIGKSVGESVPPPIDQSYTHLRGNYAVNLFMQPTDVNEIKRVVQTLKSKSSEDFGSISTKLLQETTPELTIPLEIVINQSFVTGIVPDNLKIAKIIPVFKSGNNNILNNYRPISIPPTLSKIIEKMVCNRLIMFLEKYNTLYKHQYGFRSEHSTILPILHLLKDIADARVEKIMIFFFYNFFLFFYKYLFILFIF